MAQTAPIAPIAPFVQSLKLPVMPEVARALIQTLNDDDADLTAVRDIIAQDPALTATMLRMANSAIFGMSREITNLDSAISLIGMSHIRARALSVCLSNLFSLPAGLDRMAFWQNCMVSAGYSRWLAVALGTDDSQAWLTGLILRLGRLLVIQSNINCLETLEALPCEPGKRWERERALTGFDEGQIMAEVARRWDFPDEIVQSLHVCARPPKGTSFPKLAGIVQLAALLAEYPEVTVETLAALPQDTVHLIGANLLWMGIHLPDPTEFFDHSLVPH